MGKLWVLPNTEPQRSCTKGSNGNTLNERKRKPKHCLDGTNHVNVFTARGLRLLKAAWNSQSASFECHSQWQEGHALWKMWSLLLSITQKGLVARLDAGCCRDHSFCIFPAAPENETFMFFACSHFSSLSSNKWDKDLWGEGGQWVNSHHHITKVLARESRQMCCNSRSVSAHLILC